MTLKEKLIKIYEAEHHIRICGFWDSSWYGEIMVESGWYLVAENEDIEKVVDELYIWAGLK